MDQYGYKDVFKKVMLTHAKNKIRRGWIVKQDNDPKHTPDSIKTFLNCKKIPILVWPKDPKVMKLFLNLLPQFNKI